ncbi:MAG: hypothetical protein M1821_002829 [Bathelium mastoideum]|nr:MAG: hypothetical protein M1821_002829 [Bathelium mastoideum]
MDPSEATSGQQINGAPAIAAALSPEQLETWDKNGYLIIPNVLSNDVVAELLSEAHQMLDNFDLEDHPMTKFSTGEGNDEKHVGDQYFLESGDKIRFFFEEDPPSAVGFWYALEDADEGNGCLSFAQGSHKRAPIRSRFVRMDTSIEGRDSSITDGGTNDPGQGTGFVANEGAQYPRGLAEDEEVKKEEYTMGPVKAGSLVLIHGNVLHKSERNISGRSRFIYTFHLIEGEHAGCRYDSRNWLQPTGGGFARLY